MKIFINALFAFFINIFFSPLFADEETLPPSTEIFLKSEFPSELFFNLVIKYGGHKSIFLVHSPLSKYSNEAAINTPNIIGKETATICNAKYFLITLRYLDDDGKISGFEHPRYIYYRGFYDIDDPKLFLSYDEFSTFLGGRSSVNDIEKTMDISCDLDQNASFGQSFTIISETES